MEDSTVKNTATHRSTWLVGSVGFVAGVATTLIVGALLMGGMMTMMGGGMMGSGSCNRLNTSQTPTTAAPAE